MSDVGDAITTGADMDLPASPLGPGYPGAPVLPIQKLSAYHHEIKKQ